MAPPTPNMPERMPVTKPMASVMIVRHGSDMVRDYGFPRWSRSWRD
jgi:hypothetical protein